MFNFKDFVAKHFTDSTAVMLIVTGAIGWALSSIAQMGAILVNKQISNKEKSFLIPQEFCDAIVNILLFVGMTSVARYGVRKMFTTGKWASKNVRKELKSNPFDSIICDSISALISSSGMPFFTALNIILLAILPT